MEVINSRYIGTSIFDLRCIGVSDVSKLLTMYRKTKYIDICSPICWWCRYVASDISKNRYIDALKNFANTTIGPSFVTIGPPFVTIGPPFVTICPPFVTVRARSKICVPPGGSHCSPVRKARQLNGGD
ncbi:unnamed protein product [Nesidiocoris tenuis]|uniref:Uncharacterized protein n=1 Tax=Nesidiocoris tenuis TaxID=355587 RepID=A0A6H5GJX5_9HEMI|nr:unnamed protein product [Nesidiocoris tenuis]